MEIFKLFLALIFSWFGLYTQPEPVPEPIEYCECEPSHDYEQDMENTFDKKIIDISSYDRDILAMTVYLEADTESQECQEAVCSVVLNRYFWGAYGDSIYEICTDTRQFSAGDRIVNGTVKANERNYAAVDYVLENGLTVPTNVIYFKAKGYHTMEGAIPYTYIDNTYFSYKELSEN